MTSIHQVAFRNIRIKKKHTCPTRSLFLCCQKRGTVEKLRIVNPKKPNSARRRVARVRLSNNLVVTARIKGQGHNLQSYSTVLVSGGRANDLPGVRYTLVKGTLDFTYDEGDFVRLKRRSKYGIPKNTLEK